MAPQRSAPTAAVPPASVRHSQFGPSAVDRRERSPRAARHLGRRQRPQQLVLVVGPRLAGGWRPRPPAALGLAHLPPRLLAVRLAEPAPAHRLDDVRGARLAAPGLADPAAPLRVASLRPRRRQGVLDPVLA